MKKQNGNIEICLKDFKTKGYHRRTSGSITSMEEKMICDCCGRKTNTLVGYEKDYPRNKDIGLCIMCSNDFDEI